MIPDSTDRRGFLRSAGATLLASSLGCGTSDSDSDDARPLLAPERAPEPEDWQPGGTIDESAFPCGIQAGDATHDGVVVGVYTAELSVTLVVAAAEGETWREVARAEDLLPSEGHLQHVFSNVASDTAHTLVAWSSDGSRRSRTVRFRTAAATGDAARRWVLAASSCFGDASHSYASAAHAAAVTVDAFLLLGDSVYADPAENLNAYRDYWKAFLGHPAIAEALSRTSVIAVWDDHEVANNWTLGEGDAQSKHVEPEKLEAATAAFREALPQREGGAGSRLWRSIRYGDVVEFIALDARGERTEGRLVSEEQLQWAIATIRASPAVFKCLLTSVHLTDHTALLGAIEQDDRWQGYPEQRTPLVTALAETPGTFVLTGDMHYGGVQWLAPPDAIGAHVPEIAVGPAGSDLFPVEAVAALQGETPPQYTLLLEAWTTTRLTLDPLARTVTLEFLDDAGGVVGHRVLSL
jgi:phosphodiesterase/alkaline phosphatase D-like protein